MSSVVSADFVIVTTFPARSSPPMATVTYDPEADALSILFAPGPCEGEEFRQA
jgi:hypothetical protein